VAARHQVLGRELAPAGVVDHDVRDARVADVDHDDRQAVALERGDLGVGHRQRYHEQAVHAVRPREVAERVRAVGGRLDVEEHERVAVAAGALGDAAQALDDGRRREERGDHADRERAPERQAAGGRARPVAELRDRVAHPLAHLGAHDRDVVEHARDRGHADAGVAGDVADGRRTPRRGRRALLHGRQS
jgi:hypothetical protein